MKFLHALFGTIRRMFSLPPPDQLDEIREMRPFFLLVIAVLLFLYGYAVSFSPQLRRPLPLIVFTGLMLLHITLYLFCVRFVVNRGILYLVLQSILAFGLILLAGEFTLVWGLYPPLVGLAVGILSNWRQKAVAVTVYVGLGSFSHFLIAGWGAFFEWAVMTVFITLFVVVYVVLYLRQVEARGRVQVLLQELGTAHRQLAEYATQVEDLTLVAERQRMARELHDTLTQGVAGLILQLEAVNAHLADGRSGRAQEIVQQALSRARDTLAGARRAIGDLREESPTPHGLVTAVREEVNRFTTATGISCTLDLSLPAVLPDTLSEHALRIVAEGLTNVARHAQANQVWARLAGVDDDWLEIEVRDDGVGFDPAAMANRAGHYGLLGMRERARLAGGTLEIRSAPGEGTLLLLCLPLRNQRERNG
jgi:NarL family two-component system sensor histidine kinase YdfH